MEQYASVQQLLKKEEGKVEKLPIYPPTVIQAVHDAKTGAPLESILAQYNSVYIQYQGNPKDTRNIIPQAMRRAGLTITYMNMNSETITERANSSAQMDNDHWGLDTNWSRIDELSLSGDISVSVNGTWIINGEDTGIKAVGPKGDSGITPWLKTIDNKLHYSYDNITWEECSENIAAWFRWKDNKIQISRDNKNWVDLTGKFTDNFAIKGYVASYDLLPTSASQGDIYGVGPTYAESDTEHTNPIYRYYVKNANSWVDNGSFNSISAGVVQETGNSETEVMSQKATTEKLTELGSQVIYDVTANNDGVTFASLSALLSSENLSTLIPVEVRCGGMSIRFVQSSDNKYIQARLTTDSFTTDATKWAIAEEGVYVDNPEFIYVKLDADDRILWAIKADGSIYYGAGVPQQVIDYINEKIAELSLDEYEDIVAFLADLEKGDETLQDLLDKKVDGEYVEIPEFVYVKTDAEDKILEATEKDGTKVFGGNVKVLGSINISGVNYKVVTNPEWLEVVLDAEGRIICGIRTDGTFCIVNLKFLDSANEIKDKLSFFDTADSPEFISVEVDADGKILGGRKTDGTKFENVGFTTPKVSIDGTTVENIEDPEGRSEVTTDAEGKIISYRDGDGVKHENVGIETNKANINHLNLTDTGMTEFQQALKDAGFRPGGAGDYSVKGSMYIPEPRLAHLNIITNFNLVNLTKTSDVKCQVEFFDGAGNYFKKWIILNGQGRSSLQFHKKGLGADFFNEDPNSETFDEDNVFSMKFGDWVYQDSFHIKSYYTDWPRCTTPVVYKLTDEVVRTRCVMNDRPYKKYYVGEYSDAANANTQSDLDKNMETGARCFPDGFPVIVYQNGEFWGVNAWQLKKHRDNYMLSKKKETHIHLDGDMGSHNDSTPFWLWNGTIDWSIYCSGTYGIETRNPKNLYCVDGKKYDVDTHDAEIITTATAEEWITAGQIIPTGKVIDDTLAGYLRTTGKVRASIEELTTYIPYIKGLIDGSILIDGQQATTSQIKAAIEEMFDVSSFIDYILVGNVCGNNDAWDNNGQIVTWGKLDGCDIMNWSVNVYDCDITFGCRWDGISASAANNTKLGSTYPLYKIFWDYYYDELKSRYHELRDKGVFDADHITQLFRSWMDRVGYDNYIKEYEKWDESPCFRDGSQTYVNYPTTGGFYGSIERIYLWIKKRIQYMDASDFFDYNQQ